LSLHNPILPLLFQNKAWEIGKGKKTHPTTSCALLAASASVFLAIFPLPPRPVVYISPFKVGVSSVLGSRSEELVPMFPAPPRPWDEGPGREEEEERRPETERDWGRAVIFCLV
jgi:hypothetical protein